jgi:uroporphyrinogen-III decarboxylase
VNTLLKKSRAEVRADALQRLQIGSCGGGYILSSACSVSPRVPPENLTVLVDASREYGTPPA